MCWLLNNNYFLLVINIVFSNNITTVVYITSMYLDFSETRAINLLDYRLASRVPIHSQSGNMGLHARLIKRLHYQSFIASWLTEHWLCRPRHVLRMFSWTLRILLLDFDYILMIYNDESFTNIGPLCIFTQTRIGIHEHII